MLYVACVFTPFEGTDVIGIYDSAEKAEARLNADIARRAEEDGCDPRSHSEFFVKPVEVNSDLDSFWNFPS